MTKRTSIILGVSCAALVTAGAGAAAVYTYRHDISRSLERATLPEEISYQEIKAPSTLPRPSRAAAPAETTITTPAPVAAATTGGVPAEINLALPFTSQAPHGNWQAPYKEFCEEASVLMVMRYFQNKPIVSPDDAAAALQEIQAFEKAEFGYYEDTTAIETATIIKKHFKHATVQVKVNPTVDDIKKALAAGKPVIVPAAGRQLGNPFYTPPGPLYHMLVIKGYTKNRQFITHDPGTRRGANYLYNENILMNAIHDWPGNTNIESGRSVVLIVEG